MSNSFAAPTRTRRCATVLLALTCFAVVMALVSPARSAPVANHDRIVSAVPGQTPAVNNGEVDAIVQVGNTMVVGGTFTSVTPVSGTTTTKNYLFAFNVSTGALVGGFNPALNGGVNELIPGPVADSVYVGGSFTNVNGAAASHVTLLSTVSGGVVGGFRAAATNGLVYSMIQRGNRLYVGGNFTTAGGVAHRGLTSLNATSGALDSFVNNQVTEHHNNTGSGAQGAVGVRDIDVSADGSRLVAIGNFKRVDNLSRDQVVLLSLTGGNSVVVPNWQTNRYSPYCFSGAFDTYVRGVSFSPDGSYFAVTATGGYVANTLCDAAARFETNATGNDIQPTWVNYTGGDTLWSVTVTEKAVYVGGHQRWMNNSLASDRAGAGAVPRPGLAALNVNTGVSMKWNPGRNPRGAAVYALYATPQGLWVGSDTEFIGPRHNYKRPRLAFFPLVSGAPEASDATAGLPGTAYLGGNQSPPTATTNDLRRSNVTTAGAQAGTAVADGGVAWSTVRGSFAAGDKVYYGKSDNTFNSRTFTNGTFGPEVRIDPYNDPVWAGIDTGSNNTYDGRPVDLYAQLSTVTGMAYAGGKLYYVRNNDSNLYWRWFNADSGIIGSAQFTANGGRSWNGTMGMFASGGKLYFVTRADGNLASITLTPSGPSGLPTLVNGPGAGGTDWRTRALFFEPTSGTPANNPPTAAFIESCTGLTCRFDASGSSDSDGTVASYAWKFGDTTTDSGQVVFHTYGAASTYQVELTVTDNAGAPATTAHPVVVTPTQGAAISYVAGATRTANAAAPSVPVPSGVQAGDTLVLTTSLSNATSASAPAGWTLKGDQSATATLRSLVWVKTATAGDVGGSVAVTMDAVHKATLALTAYRGANASAATATANTDAGTSSHTTPQVTVTNGSWVVSAWADKSANTHWTTPASVTLRAEAYSTASGAVSQAVADPAGPRSGIVPGTTATSSVSSTRGVNWSIVLPPL